MATFLGALVAKLSDSTVLASAVFPGATFDLKVLSESLIKTQGKKNNKLTIPQTGFQVTLSTDDSIVVAVATLDSVPKKNCLVFIEDVRKLFNGMYTEPSNTLTSDMCRQFKPLLVSNLQKASTEAATGKVTEIRGTLDDIRDVMTENIERVIERNGRIESLVEQSEELDDVAQHFRSRAKTVRKKMWWDSVKMKVFLAVGVAVLIVIVSMVACGGPSYPKCR